MRQNGKSIFEMYLSSWRIRNFIKPPDETLYKIEYRGDMRDWPGFDELPSLTPVGVPYNQGKDLKISSRMSEGQALHHGFGRIR